mmetsp:Transcript_4794/g.8243  ORF Transcript_4794/g.8243 Transcript_4794/m.8243 type:complete len:284 (-) Transcript_4794:218-1069(-)|eukprot:CAMPEP_0198211752 /NCGR_PEP_ID=MMETSP1445-20131203/25321_1 /TAXON_ID=36898 /ORGANISM="Pyramimonas sp., Strain CCMP2087" /LENGTH=283 /DNA_ID=CAMNT_0043886081 /DNA_START=152 /DNA_END=1003 /DNA_ORIENTATION=-
MKPDTLAAVTVVSSLTTLAVGVGVLLAWNVDPPLRHQLCYLFTRKSTAQEGKKLVLPRTAVELRPVDHRPAQDRDTCSDECCFSTPTKSSFAGEPFETPSPLCLDKSGFDKPDPYSPSKRSDYVSWDEYFMAVAYLSAARSKDPNRQVGACIVGSDKVILGIGYNGFPRGCSDDALPWAKLAEDDDVLKTKYPYVCHAEMNAIMNKNSASLAGASIYVTLYPCNECAKLIIQAGIQHVIFCKGKLGGAGKVDPSYTASNRLFQLAGVDVAQLQPKRSFTISFD